MNERGVAQKQRAELLRPLDAKALHLRGDARDAPLTSEVLLRNGTVRLRRIVSTAADDHQVRPRPVPQRTVAEDIAETAQDRPGAGVAQVRERQPVGHDATIGETIVNELEIFT